MNGDVNGIMTEPMDISLSSSPAHKSNQKEVTQGDCDDNINDCENSSNAESSNVDIQHENGTLENGLPEDKPALSDENSNDLDGEASTEGTTAIEESSKNGINEHSDGSDCQTNTDSQVQLDCLENPKIISNVLSNEQDQESIDEHCMEGDSDSDEGSRESGEPKADTVSINSESEPGSDDDTSQDGQIKLHDIIVLDAENRIDNITSEVHEIVSDNENDDCVIASREAPRSNHSDEKVQLRRSSRTIKRRKYTDSVENGDESDIEETIEFPDPLKRKGKPIIINDAKTLVAMAAKQIKGNHGTNQKREPTVVILDTHSIVSDKLQPQLIKKSSTVTSSIAAQNLYQSIVARGTTVTPVSNKNSNNSTQATEKNSQPSILPSLTDDMFVVEAPSFIVPYVYEKPSIKPFREFVDQLGKELDEEKLKEEKKEKERKDKEKQERRERGEEVKSDDESNVVKSKDIEEENRKKLKKEKKRRTNFEDDASWDGESLSESDDEVLSDEDDKIVVKDKTEPLEQINVVGELTVDKICSNKVNGVSSMDCTLGKFFINIGLNLVQEFVQTDLLKQQNRKLYKEKKAGHSTKATESSIAQLMKNLEFSKENNAPYSTKQNKCEFCSFKTESKLVMAQHLETPHMKNNMYKCNFCTFEIRSPHDILVHMEVNHNVRGKLERAPSYHQCSNCPFEDNGKGKLARHLIACAKKFKPDSNLAPPVDWEPPAKIPKIARPRNNMGASYQTAFNRNQGGGNVRGPNPGLVSGLSIPVGVGIPGYRARGRSPLPPRLPPVHGLPIIRGPSMIRANVTTPVAFSNSFTLGNNMKPKSTPSISITPLPRQPPPASQSQGSNSNNNKSSFVICEICDGYIKDLEQLRNHMQWIHKVKIHPKMIYNRPPLNCQKCQFRFFTDQGLERHLLGSHGLVTSSMQEAANKGKDAGRCPVCGRVYQWKLLSHVARDHNLTLKPAHLSYKCTVCTATFGMYKQFENHVYSAHSVVAKRVIDKSKTAAGSDVKIGDTSLKPLKINDEITITPQPAKSSASAKEK